MELEGGRSRGRLVKLDRHHVQHAQGAMTLELSLLGSEVGALPRSKTLWSSGFSGFVAVVAAVSQTAPLEAVARGPARAPGWRLSFRRRCREGRGSAVGRGGGSAIGRGAAQGLII